MQLQQWVLSKEEDEALADRASGSEDAFLVVRESRIPIVQNCLYVPHFFLAKVILNCKLTGILLYTRLSASCD